MSRVIINFPTREEEMRLAIDAWCRAGVKLLLCHGVSLDRQKNKYQCDCGDTTCRNAGKHPIAHLFPKGEYSATNDSKVLKEMLAENKNANIAAVIERFFVIDIDGPKGAKYVRRLNIPRTLCTKTGRGRHLFFKGSLPDNLKSIEQVDIKTKGYIMLAPSRHKTGAIYRRVS